MEPFYKHVIAILIGVTLAYMSIFIIGAGAAIAIPSEILKPLVQISSMFAFTLVDLVTIAVPLSLTYLVLAFLGAKLIKAPSVTFYALVLIPLILLQLYFILQSQAQETFNLATTFPRLLLLVTVFYVFARNVNRSNG
ncbi:hypothetical protein [Glaciecola sp. 1036]|uniref:hypothetical protein n=1 Tax=Alteromonadaceae TaxID=72275 RepID=UPI003CFE171E